MNKIKFLSEGIEVIFITIVLSLIFTFCKDESFTWFIILVSITLLFFLIGWFICEKTIGKARNYKEFTNHLKLTYAGNLNELISDFITCDLFFHRQIGDCYTFSSKRRLWHNQMFFVEKIGGVLHIICNQYSLNQLKQHPASSVFNKKINNATKNNSGEKNPIVFDKVE